MQTALLKKILSLCGVLPGYQDQVLLVLLRKSKETLTSKTANISIYFFLVCLGIKMSIGIDNGFDLLYVIKQLIPSQNIVS